MPKPPIMEDDSEDGVDEEEEKSEALGMLKEKYDTDDDGELSIEELAEVDLEDQDLVDTVLVDYPALKAELDSLLEQRQSRAEAEVEADRKMREAQEAKERVELKRKDEIQTSETALNKVEQELRQLNEQITDMERAEQSRKEKAGAETEASEEAKVAEEERFNNEIRAKEASRLDLDEKAGLLDDALAQLHAKEEGEKKHFEAEIKRLKEERQDHENQFRDEIKRTETGVAKAKSGIKKLAAEEENLFEEYTEYRTQQETEERERNRRAAKDAARYQTDLAAKQAAVERFDRDANELRHDLDEKREKDIVRKRLAAEEARRRQQAEIEERETDLAKAEEDAKKIEEAKREVADTGSIDAPDTEGSLPRPGAEVKPPLKPLEPGPKPDGPIRVEPIAPKKDTAEDDPSSTPPSGGMSPLPKPPGVSDDAGDAPSLPKPPGAPSFPKPPGASDDAPALPKPPSLPPGGLPKPPGTGDNPGPSSTSTPSEAEKELMENLLRKTADRAVQAQQKSAENKPELPGPRSPLDAEDTPDLPKPPGLPTPPGAGGPPDLPKPPSLPKPPGASGPPDLPKPPGLPTPPGGAPPMPPAGDLAEEARQQTLDQEKQEG